jgi:hypothetical protein
LLPLEHTHNVGNLPATLAGVLRTAIGPASAAGQLAVRSVVVIPAQAGIQAVPRIWIPAYAGMTLPFYIHAPGRTFNMHNTL